MAIITKIEEFNDGCIDGNGGFRVYLDDGEVIKLWLNIQGSCCETFGYFMSEDDVTSFVGAEVLSVERVDTALNVSRVEVQLQKEGCCGFDEGGIMFVNVNTNQGVLQFVAYNSHNGYYGHMAGVVSRYHTEEECL